MGSKRHSGLLPREPLPARFGRFSEYRLEIRVFGEVGAPVVGFNFEFNVETTKMDWGENRQCAYGITTIG